jgi:hypothetical protein
MSYVFLMEQQVDLIPASCPMLPLCAHAVLPIQLSSALLPDQLAAEQQLVAAEQCRLVASGDGLTQHCSITCRLTTLFG